MTAVFSGILFAWSATGTEGVHWSLQEAKWITTRPDGSPDWDYRGLQVLKNGDRLTVFAGPDNDEVYWHGVVKLERKRRWRSFGNPDYPSAGQQEVAGWYVHGLQVGMEPEAWGEMFFNERKARLERD